MNSLRIFFASYCNRLIVLTVVCFALVNGVWSGQASGFELYYWQNPKFQLWQPLSYLFLHGSLSHLLFNMFALWSFGQVMERALGSKLFICFYLACGIGAGLILLGVNYWQFNGVYQQLLAVGLSVNEITEILNAGKYTPSLIGDITAQTMNEFYNLYHTPAVGASGAIYGVLVGFTLLFPNFRVMLIFLPIPIAAKYFVPALLAIDLLAGVTGFSIFGFNIAHFAHLGGALIGFILIKYLYSRA